MKRFLRSVPARLYGTHIDQGEQFTSLSTKAHFLPNEILEARIAAARDLIGPHVVVKPDRKPIEDQEDSFKRPINYDDWL